MKYSGKKIVFAHVQKLCILIGCKIPKRNECEYYRWQGEEVLKWEYIEGDRFIKVSAYVVANSDPLITRVYFNEYDDDGEIIIAHGNYKFSDVYCDYCHIKENRGRLLWKNLLERKVVNG